MVDIILHVRDSLLLLLLLGTEEGGDSRDGDAPTHDGEGDDAGDKAGEGPEDMLDWVKEVGRFLLVLVPSLPVQGHLIAEDDRGVPPHAAGGDGDCLALVKVAVAPLALQPEDAWQAVPHRILRALKDFFHTHLMAIPSVTLMDKMRCNICSKDEYAPPGKLGSTEHCDCRQIYLGRLG